MKKYDVRLKETVGNHEYEEEKIGNYHACKCGNFVRNMRHPWQILTNIMTNGFILSPALSRLHKELEDASC